MNVVKKMRLCEIIDNIFFMLALLLCGMGFILFMYRNYLEAGLENHIFIYFGLCVFAIATSITFHCLANYYEDKLKHEILEEYKKWKEENESK